MSMGGPSDFNNTPGAEKKKLDDTPSKLASALLRRAGQGIA